MTWLLLQGNPNMMFLGYAVEFVDFEGFNSLDLRNPYRELQAIPMKKDSEFWKLFHHELTRQREFGLMKRARDRWIPKQIKPTDEQAAEVLGFEILSFPFLLLLSSCVVAFVCLGAEIIYSIFN